MISPDEAAMHLRRAYGEMVGSYWRITQVAAWRCGISVSRPQLGVIACRCGGVELEEVARPRCAMPMPASRLAPRREGHHEGRMAILRLDGTKCRALG